LTQLAGGLPAWRPAPCGAPRCNGVMKNILTFLSLDVDFTAQGSDGGLVLRA
jgi:hypothetical protein